MLSFEQIKELIDLISERDLQGLELERSGFKIKIDGRAGAVASAASVPASGPPSASPAAPAEAARPQEAPSAPAAEEDPLSGAHVVNSPIVGTFYAASSPDAEPYVRAGDRVKKGQVLCIVEAMKLMNEIESDVDGVVLKVLPDNAQPVEYGEPLFAIEPS